MTTGESLACFIYSTVVFTIPALILAEVIIRIRKARKK